VRILFTGVIFSDYLIPKVISDYLSIAFRDKLMITVAKPQALVSFKKYMRKGHIFFEWNKCLWAKHIIILVIIRSLATPYAGPHKLFRSFLKLPCCIFTVAERKQSKAVISFEEWNWKSCSAALQFLTPFERFFCFLSHLHLRPFSFILHPKAELMNETAIDDYSSVRICLNVNIPTCTFLFINRWCQAKKPSLMRGRGIPIHKNTTTGSTL
jgi:hypothetical protein